jgi:hypothetical protein
LKHKVPSVKATLTMLPDKVRYPNRARYMPHIVLGDPSQREAIIGPKNTITERYLGVLISDAPDELAPGRSIEVSFQLMYWPEERYEGIAPGGDIYVARRFEGCRVRKYSIPNWLNQHLAHHRTGVPGKRFWYTFNCLGV